MSGISRRIEHASDKGWDPRTKVILGMVLLILAPFQPLIPGTLFGEGGFTLWWLILGGLVGTPVMIIGGLWAFASSLSTRNRPRSR